MKTLMMLSSLLVATTAASASPLNETFSVAIYQGTGNADPNNANNQANQSNPLINPASELGAGTYAGALDLNIQRTDPNTISAFFATAGSSIAGLSGTALGDVLSIQGYVTTTVMVITGDTNGAILGGTISHDDGVSLYDGPGFTNLVVGSASPTSEIPTSFSGLFGPFELVYVEAEGLPAVLDVEITSSVSNTPLPATLPMFAGGLGLFWWMRGRRKTPTSILGCLNQSAS